MSNEIPKIMSSDDELNTLINDTEPNVDFTNEPLLPGEDGVDYEDRLELKFRELLEFDRDDEYSGCYPVMVYTLNHQIAGFYDIEMRVGYIA